MSKVQKVIMYQEHGRVEVRLYLSSRLKEIYIAILYTWAISTPVKNFICSRNQYLVKARYTIEESQQHGPDDSAKWMHRTRPVTMLRLRLSIGIKSCSSCR